MDKKVIIENLVDSLKGNLMALKEICGADYITCRIFEDGHMLGYGLAGENNTNVLDFHEIARGF